LPWLRLSAPALLLVLGLTMVLTAVSPGPRSARAAIGENDVAFSVTQSPGTPGVLMRGSIVTFTVTGTVAVTQPALFFELTYPSGLLWGGVTSGTGVVCTNNAPLTGTVRCDYTAVSPGALPAIALNFTIDATFAGSPVARVRAGVGDPTGDAGDDGDDTVTGFGPLDIFDAPAGGSVTIADSFSPSGPIFEGGSTVYAAVFTNQSGTGTGLFAATVAFINGTVTGVTCNASAGGQSGAGSGIGTSNASCVGMAIASPGTVTIGITVIAANGSASSTLTPDITSQDISLTSGEYAETTAVINEVGLENTGAGLVLGAAINVCTNTVPADVANLSAAGGAQPNNAALLLGASFSPVLQAGDFSVTGAAAGPIVAATGCTANQSGVRFTPAQAGTYTVNANYNLGGQNSLTLIIANPAPTASLLSPSSKTAGDAAFTLTVTGTNFVTGSTLLWNGSPRTTTVLSATQLTAAILAADVVSASSATVTVNTPGPGGGTSGGLTFTTNPVVNPVPALSNISPPSAAAGGASFTLTATGANFINGSLIRWNGTTRATTYVDTTHLTAAISAADIASVGTRSIDVVTGAPGGGTSTGMTFNVTSVPNPDPTLTTLSPASATAGAVGFTVNVNGTGFVGGSVVWFDGIARPTTYVGATQLRISVVAADIALAGSHTVEVFSPAPGGGTSNQVSLPVNNPLPTATSIAPPTVTAGSASFTLNVNGTGYNESSVVRLDDVGQPTAFVSATQLRITIDDSTVATAGTHVIKVFTAAPGGGTSGALNLSVTNPAPTTSAITPTTTLAQGPGFTLTVNGTGFIEGVSTVRWNGSARTTTFVSATQLTAAINAADIANAGAIPVTVNNPSPGGGTSNSQSFAVTSHPSPTLGSISPPSATTGGPEFTLTLTGTNYISLSVVRVNGADRETVFVSSTQLTATILASDIAAAGSKTVTVFSPAPGGGTSPSRTLTVSAPTPTPTATNTPLASSTPTSTATPTPTQSATTTATASPSQSPSPGASPSPSPSSSPSASPSASPSPSASASPSVSPTPVTSQELAVLVPIGNVPRSRLTFTASDGSLTPAEVSFVIKRKSDNKYWKGTTNEWLAAPFENTATQVQGGLWTYSPVGNARRLFVNTKVVVEVHAMNAGAPLTGSALPEIPIR
jgi:hypothetical protein